MKRLNPARYHDNKDVSLMVIFELQIKYDPAFRVHREGMIEDLVTRFFEILKMNDDFLLLHCPNFCGIRTT